MTKVVSLEVIKQYKDFYSEKKNQELALKVFFKCDNRFEKSNTSKIS
jgi:hypothetical protein